MTGRQDVAPVATVKAEHLHKDLHNFQGSEDVFRRQEVLKQTKRSGQLSKSARPPMEIYSPRKIISKNGTKVHFVEGNVARKTSQPSSALPCELKSALKRSKSFTASEPGELDAIGFEKDAFPVEYQGLIRQAVLDPNSLPSQKLMELVRLICSKAVEHNQYSEPAARLCFSIIEKEHDHTFLESLQNCCREWFNERDKLLRTPFLMLSGTTASGLRRWMAYVTFLTELYFRVKNQHSKMIQANPVGNISVHLLGPHPNSPMAHLALTLQTLLFECGNIILKPPSLSSEGEVEVLRKMLVTVGQQLESDAALRMQQLVVNLRDAFVNPSITAHNRKSLLEVIELHASGWQLDLPQSLYYFPYTRL